MTGFLLGTVGGIILVISRSQRTKVQRPDTLASSVGIKVVIGLKKRALASTRVARKRGDIAHRVKSGE
jgi:hypothetical protein